MRGKFREREGDAHITLKSMCATNTSIKDLSVDFSNQKEKKAVSAPQTNLLSPKH